MIPNDSGEREVCDLRSLLRDARPLVEAAYHEAGEDTEAAWRIFLARIDRALRDHVSVSGPLAQRILAALEAFENLSLAAELRAIVERKT